MYMALVSKEVEDFGGQKREQKEIYVQTTKKFTVVLIRLYCVYILLTPPGESK